MKGSHPYIIPCDALHILLQGRATRLAVFVITSCQHGFSAINVAGYGCMVCARLSMNNAVQESYRFVRGIVRVKRLAKLNEETVKLLSSY